MNFSKDFPDNLRSQILTSQVVGKIVKLKKQGKEYSGLCPFHNEKTPSFTVNDQKGFYHCFGCGAHGDIITFVMNKQGLDFKEAVLSLASDFSIAVPQVKYEKTQEEKSQIDQQYQILEEICHFFEKNLYLESSSEIRNYLKKRGLNAKIAKKFRLGFAPNSYDSLINFLKSKSYSEQEILKTGVVSKNDRGNLYDKQRNRIIFPILDKKKRVIAFGGRIIDDSLPKYLNSAETEFFKKKHILYNFAEARNAIFKKSCAVVVEGYMDVIKLSSNGVENVVAGLGTALSDSHLSQLFAITDKIIMCLDGDNAGIMAAKRALEIALPIISSQKNIGFAFLSDGMDPDDFINKNGAKEFEKFLAQSAPMSQVMIDFAINDLALDQSKQISPESKAKLESYLNTKAELIKDSLSKKYFLQYFKDWIYRFGRNNGKNNGPITSKVKNNKKETKLNLADVMAKNIICYIIKDNGLANYQDDDFDIRELRFCNENLTAIKDSIIEIIDLQNDTNQNKVLAELEKLDYSCHLIDIKNTLSEIELDDFYQARFKVLLFKELLIKLEQQYQSCLIEADAIKTHHSAISDQKIKEIFDYKNSIEQKILNLEQELL